jgi:hypothetical protein
VAHQTAFVFFDLQELFDQFDRNALLLVDFFKQGTVLGAAFACFFVHRKFFSKNFVVDFRDRRRIVKIVIPNPLNSRRFFASNDRKLDFFLHLLKSF